MHSLWYGVLFGYQMAWQASGTVNQFVDPKKDDSIFCLVLTGCMSSPTGSWTVASNGCRLGLVVLSEQFMSCNSEGRGEI
jgi:hypothetical protein